MSGVPNGNGKTLGWTMAFIAFAAQMITIVWTIATMNATINSLSLQMHDVAETIKTINAQLQANSIDIRLLQQVKR
jgi:hypothetical protein